ncbi:GTP-binding protein [Marinomonas sp. C2222]|uniref:GTP-binding protein n=1 Tax=Marinomonas sargassi TaxID=2984494 RepID=A0ABT2YTG4_9GAMM|nr:GTP-binding protein [Marinomonas sargassi]MCV2403193.1 GTP-binding protein [Marinomonas sargassi]
MDKQKATPRYQGIKVTMVTGFLGAGKTTLIRHILQQAPANERWAVLVNEFGDIGLDGAFYSDLGVAIKEVPGGCVCCVTSAAFQQGLNKLICEQNPDRIFIEPSGLGHPKQIIQKLRSQTYQDVLLLTGVICVLDARNLQDERYTEHELFNDQIESAHGIVFSHVDLYDESDIVALNERFGVIEGNSLESKLNPQLFYATSMEFSHEDLDLGLEDIQQTSSLEKAPEQSHSHDHGHSHDHSHTHDHSHSHDHEHSHKDDAESDQFTSVNGKSIAVSSYQKCQDSMMVAGWRWPLNTHFSVTELESVIKNIAKIEGVYRIKGVFSIDDNEAAFVNVSRGEVSIRLSQWQQDSRMEVIGNLANDWLTKIILPA